MILDNSFKVDDITNALKMRNYSNKILCSFEVARYIGSDKPLGREMGAEVHAKVIDVLRALPPQAILCLDFQNILFATPAGINEILNLFNELTREEFKDKFVVLRLNNSNNDLLISFNFIVKDKGLTVLVITEAENYRILGKVSKSLRDTLKIIEDKKVVTSKTISRNLGIPLSAASARLRKLNQLKLISREEEALPFTGGRQFLYHWLVNDNSKFSAINFRKFSNER